MKSRRANETAENSSNPLQIEPRRYKVFYLGYAVLDRRYTLPMLPWIIAEIKRHHSHNAEDIYVELSEESLKAVNCEKEHVVFEHRFQIISKLAQTPREPSYFTYITREVSNGPCACHVFQAHNESTIPELFASIRHIMKALNQKVQAKSNAKANGDSSSGHSNGKECEVFYMGRLKVLGCKAPPSFIDDAVQKLKYYAHEKMKCQHDSLQDHAQCSENRTMISQLSPHLPEEISIASEQSLSNVTEESCLQSLSVLPQENSILKSSVQDHQSSYELCESTTIPEDSCDQVFEAQVDKTIQSSNENVYTKDVNVRTGSSSEINQSSIENWQQQDRTMLFVIGISEIHLSSTDRQQIYFQKSFSDISHCSQGVINSNCFGFVCRETTLINTDCYVGYIFKCQTGIMVDELMQMLKHAFYNARLDYDKNCQNSQVPKFAVCESCPMQWFHKTCTEIEGLSAEKTQLFLFHRLGELPDAEKAEILFKFQSISLTDIQEQNEELMRLLRTFCELKQSKHSHAHRAAHDKKNHITFLKEPNSSRLDSFRERAKKSLSNSFDTFLRSRTLKGKDERRERSVTSLSDNAIPNTLLSIEESNAEDADTRSYREGSYDGERSSGASSPIPVRKRSSTFSSSRDVQKADKTSKARSQNRSPILSIFMKVGSQSKSTSGASEERTSTDTSSSWRQAIFHRVQTPVEISEQKKSYNSCSVTLKEEAKTSTRKSKQELRALWKKAILEQILLIRMEKENKKLQANQDAASHKRMKLNYEEITPCLKVASNQWDEILSDPRRFDICIDKAKVAELVKAGVPRHKRGEIWLYLAKKYCTFWKPSVNECTGIDHPMSYEELLKQLTSHQHAILIDLGRTFPNHPYFCQTLGAGQLALFNMLKAYSLLDSEVGYCQGLSFVAGVLLLHMPEDHAFYLMKHMLFHLGIRTQYKPDMVQFQLQMYQLSRLIHDNYKEVYDHLEKYDIAPTLYAAPWFLTLFASQFPLGFVARLFDLIFLQGIEVIFKVSLLLLGNHKEVILMHHGFETIMEFLKTTLPSLNVIQMERIFNQVFNLDISQQLHTYEVEYSVLQEEVMWSSQCVTTQLKSLKSTNQELKTKNVALIEQLQVAYSRIHSLEASLASYKSTIQRLEAHKAALEEEKEALLNSLNIMKCRLKKLETAHVHAASEGHERTLTFSTVYALAGTEREEDRQFKQFMQELRKESAGSLSAEKGNKEETDSN